MVKYVIQIPVEVTITADNYKQALEKINPLYLDLAYLTSAIVVTQGNEDCIKICNPVVIGRLEE